MPVLMIFSAIDRDDAVLFSQCVKRNAPAALFNTHSGSAPGSGHPRRSR